MTPKALADAIDPLPCPFCGAPAHWHEARCLGEHGHIACENPNCFAECSAFNYANKADTIAAWNRRHAAEPTAGVREAAQAVVDFAWRDGRPSEVLGCLLNEDVDTIATIISARLSPAPTGLAAEFEKLAGKAWDCPDTARPYHLHTLGFWAMQHRTALTRALTSLEEKKP